MLVVLVLLLLGWVVLVLVLRGLLVLLVVLVRWAWLVSLEGMGFWGVCCREGTGEVGLAVLVAGGCCGGSSW